MAHGITKFSNTYEKVEFFISIHSELCLFYVYISITLSYLNLHLEVVCLSCFWKFTFPHAKNEGKYQIQCCKKFMVWYRLVIWNYKDLWVNRNFACFTPKYVASANSVEEFEKPFCISLRIISRFITSASSDFIWYLFVGFNDILQHMQFFTKLHNWMDSTIKVAKVYLLQRNLYRKK